MGTLIQCPGGTISLSLGLLLPLSSRGMVNVVHAVHFWAAALAELVAPEFPDHVTGL